MTKEAYDKLVKERKELNSTLRELERKISKISEDIEGYDGHQQKIIKKTLEDQLLERVYKRFPNLHPSKLPANWERKDISVNPWGFGDIEYRIVHLRPTKPKDPVDVYLEIYEDGSSFKVLIIDYSDFQILEFEESLALMVHINEVLGQECLV